LTFSRLPNSICSCNLILLRLAKPSEPTFMDRSARVRGFRWRDDEQCYAHARGAWIEKGEAHIKLNL
jgi:hypothetical protein